MAQKVMAAMKNMWDISRQLPTPTTALMQGTWRSKRTSATCGEKAQMVSSMTCITLDLGFWRRHIQGPLEMRQGEKVTIIAGSVDPSHSAFVDITRVIENHFVVVRATR
jgi:hypothetical protein